MPKLTDLYSVNRLSTLQELQQHWKTQAHPYETCLFFSFFNHSTVSSFPLHFSLALPFLSPVCPTARKLLLQCSSHGSTPTAAQLLSAGLCPQILCLAKIFRPSESSACTMSCLQQIAFYFASLTTHSFHFLALISKQRLARAILC